MGTISFPGLGISVNPGTGFDIGPLRIQYYGLIIATGLLLCCIYGLRRGKDFGISQDDILDGALWIIPFSIVCARLYYCIFYWKEGGYSRDPLSILYIWKGGLAIYGAVIGAAVGIVIYCWKKKIPITTGLDIAFVTFPLGQAIGRWGNFFNREAYGSETDSFLRMGLTDGLGRVTYHHPTFLYESLWNILGFVLLYFWSKKRKFDGQMALAYTAWYGLGRAFIEGLRTDSLYLGPFRVSQLLAAVSCIAAVGLLIWQSTKIHDPANLFVNRVAAQGFPPGEAVEQSETDEDCGQ